MTMIERCEDICIRLDSRGTDSIGDVQRISRFVDAATEYANSSTPGSTISRSSLYPSETDMWDVGPVLDTHD